MVIHIKHHRMRILYDLDGWSSRPSTDIEPVKPKNPNPNVEITQREQPLDIWKVIPDAVREQLQGFNIIMPDPQHISISKPWFTPLLNGVKYNDPTILSKVTKWVSVKSQTTDGSVSLLLNTDSWEQVLLFINNATLPDYNKVQAMRNSLIPKLQSLGLPNSVLLRPDGVPVLSVWIEGTPFAWNSTYTSFDSNRRMLESIPTRSWFQIDANSKVDIQSFIGGARIIVIDTRTNEMAIFQVWAPTNIPQVAIDTERPSGNPSSLSFFNLPPEQNTGGDGLNAVVNFFRDANANGGRETIRTANILNNISTIARLWNTSQISPEQKNLFLMSLTSWSRLWWNGYRAIDQIQPNGEGFSITVRKTNLNQAEMQEKLRISQEQAKTNPRDVQRLMFLSNQARSIDDRVGHQVPVYVNSQNWRNVL